jgi:hypothetical protein
MYSSQNASNHVQTTQFYLFQSLPSHFAAYLILAALTGCSSIFASRKLIEHLQLMVYTTKLSQRGNDRAPK